MAVLRSLRSALLRIGRAPQQSLAGRSFLVTGTAPGSLGFATARILLEWGGHVTVTRRRNSQDLVGELSAGLGDEARRRVEARDLNLSDKDSVEAFIRWSHTNTPKLDVLINNAGIHLDLLSRWKEPRLSADGFEVQWRTNFMGTAQLTLGLLPLLLKRAAEIGDARVVTLVSMLHSKGRNAELFGTGEDTRPYNSWNAYGNSKLALVHLTRELDRRYRAGWQTTNRAAPYANLGSWS